MPWLHVYLTLGLELCSIVPSMFALWRCTASRLVAATHSELESHIKYQLRQAGFQLGFPVPLTKPFLTSRDMLEIVGWRWSLQNAGTIELAEYRFFSLQWDCGECSVYASGDWQVHTCHKHTSGRLVSLFCTANEAIAFWLSEIANCLGQRRRLNV